METINGATVILPDPAGVPAELARGPVMLGPELTNGAYAGMVGVMPAGDPAPPMHIHPHTDETFYVAEGELTFLLGDREVVAPAGSFVFVPRGTVHTAWNSGGVPMRGILLLSPGGAKHLLEPVESS